MLNTSIIVFVLSCFVAIIQYHWFPETLISIDHTPSEVKLQLHTNRAVAGNYTIDAIPPDTTALKLLDVRGFVVSLQDVIRKDVGPQDLLFFNRNLYIFISQNPQHDNTLNYVLKDLSEITDKVNPTSEQPEDSDLVLEASFHFQRTMGVILKYVRLTDTYDIPPDFCTLAFGLPQKLGEIDQQYGVQAAELLKKRIVKLQLFFRVGSWFYSPPLNRLVGYSRTFAAAEFVALAIKPLVEEICRGS